MSRDLEDLISISREHNLYIIEDCAPSAGAEYKNIKIGNFGDAAVFSLQHSKSISSGDGGIAVTNDELLSKRLRVISEKCEEQSEDLVRNVLQGVKSIFTLNKLSNHKQLSRFYYYYNRLLGRTVPININKQERDGELFPGYMKKYSNSLAVLALNQLKKIDVLNKKRSESAAKWFKWARENEISTPLVLSESKPVYLRYPLLLDANQRTKLIQLKKCNHKVGNWMNNHLASSEPYYPNQPNNLLLPNAKFAINNIINLPCL